MKKGLGIESVWLEQSKGVRENTSSVANFAKVHLESTVFWLCSMEETKINAVHQVAVRRYPLHCRWTQLRYRKKWRGRR